jgi:hypothetical protein
LRVISKVVVLFCLLPLTIAHSQTPPSNLPVVFESDDARDGLYEAATDALAQLHFAEGVPLAQLTVACGQGRTISPYRCVSGTFHQRYKDWIAQHPGMIEIGHHGLTHTETYATLTRAQQLDLITKGLQQIQTWGLPQGRPSAFAPPFSSENTDTISVLQQLGYLTSIRNSDTCLPSSMDNFCESVSLCARDANGNRVTGPTCVLLSPSTLIGQVNARQSEGKVFLVYHVQDVLLPDLVTVDTSKIASMRAIFRAFVAEQTAGHYQLMTFETHRSATPQPTPGADLDVFRDALASPWIDSSWSATVDYTNASPVFAGTRSIKVAANGFGALSVHGGNWGAAQEIDPSRYQAVELEVRSSTAGMRLALQLENDAGEAFPAVIVGTLPVNQWVSVSVSIAQLDPGGRLFDRIDVFDYAGTTRTFFVDDLRVVGATPPSPTPTVTPTRTPTPPAATPTPTPPAASPTPTSPPPVTPTPTAPSSTPTLTPTPAPPTPTLTSTQPPTATATPIRTPVPDLRVYQDSLASPWIDASWSATIDFANTTPVFEGTRSIKVVETGWGALSVHNGSWVATQPLDPSGYQSVSFRVFTATSGFTVYVQLENDARAPFPAVVAASIPANQWTAVTVPISQLDPNGQLFDRVDIGDANGVSRTYFVDDLRLVGR